MSPKALNHLRRAAVICFGLAIILGSLTKGVAGPSILSDKMQHLLSYAGWTALVAASPRGVGRILAYAAVIGLTGIAIEALQPLVGRQASLYDSLANFAGIAAGLAGGLALRSRLYDAALFSRPSG